MCERCLAAGCAPSASGSGCANRATGWVPLSRVSDSSTLSRPYAVGSEGSLWVFGDLEPSKGHLVLFGDGSRRNRNNASASSQLPDTNAIALGARDGGMPDTPGPRIIGMDSVLIHRA